MRHAVFVLVLLVLLLPGPGSEAAEKDGNWLYDKCISSLPVNIGFCSGYFYGFDNAHGFLLVDKPNILPLYCRPDTYPVQHYIEVIVKWLRGHPESRRKMALSATVLALQGAFPCKGEKSGEEKQ